MSNYADNNQNKLYTKFPTTHFLSNPKNVDHVLLWNTLFRRNLHKLAIDYLKINLHIYQAVVLYLMGINQFIVIIACRAAAKSFIIALFACCRCITRPYTKIVLSSATKGQSKLIVSEKIKSELMNMSPMLRKEISSIKDNQNEVIVFFKNHSTITVVPASENGRGYRSSCCIREEFRQIEKKIDDSILSPFQTIRQAPYMITDPYKDMKELQEDPVDVYISSSWLDNGHWMWDIVNQSYNGMLNDEGSYLLAFDESITLKHNIKTMKQLTQEQKKQDPLTWRIEFLNERVKENTSAFFTYSMLLSSQTLKQIFYPRKNEDVRNNKKNKYAILKQKGEVRVIGCDIAFVEGKANDNSVYTCVRAVPETLSYSNENSDVEIKQGYKRCFSYIESSQGGDVARQALRIRQLYEDFEADYICLDCRNGGILILYALSKTIYDEERGIEYPPLKCMNNEVYANAIKNPNAKEVIYAINATQQLNSDIAYSFRTALVEHRIEFLVNHNDAIEKILSKFDEYNNTDDANLMLDFEKPFIETQLLISETAELVYEKSQQTGAIKIYEQGNNRKDRYSSSSYSNFLIDKIELDLLSNIQQTDFTQAPRCISTFSY